MLKIEQSGSFHEHYTASNTSSMSSTTFSSNQIFYISFSPIFEASLKGQKNNFATSWRNTLEEDYVFAVKLELTSLSAFYELPSKLLAGFVDIDDDDSDGVKTQKLLDNYSRFQKVGLRLWINQDSVWNNSVSGGSGSWIRMGETILQNKGIQMKINLLPYLGVTTFDMLSGQIGIQFVDKGNGTLSANFSGVDYLTLVGEWHYVLTAFPRVTGVVNLVHSLPTA